jgi:hypothetical protein
MRYMSFMLFPFPLFPIVRSHTVTTPSADTMRNDEEPSRELGSSSSVDQRPECDGPLPILHSFMLSGPPSQAPMRAEDAKVYQPGANWNPQNPPFNGLWNGFA